jgi:hypothetical protein
MLVKSGKFVANTVFSGTYAYNASNLVEFSATHYQPTEQQAGSRSNYPTYKLTNMRPNDSTSETYLRVNLAQYGLGGDQSWGATPLSGFTINVAANRTYQYNYLMMPVTGFNKQAANDYYMEVHNVSANISELLQIAVNKGISTTSAVYQAAYAFRNSYTDEVAATNAYNNLKLAVQGLYVRIDSVSKASNKLEVATTVMNIGPAPVANNFSVILAVYDINGKLAAVTPQNIDTLATDASKPVTFTVDNFTVAAGFTAKAFVWDSATFNPLSVFYNVNLN